MNKPHPGSREAQAQGCTCPVLDNNFGEGMPDGHGGIGFDVYAGCPLHAFDHLPKLLYKVAPFLGLIRHGLMRKISVC